MPLILQPTASEPICISRRGRFRVLARLGGGGGAPSATNTNLSVFAVDGSDVVDGQTVNLANGTSSVDLYVFPQDVNATITVKLGASVVGYVPVLSLDAGSLSLSDGDPVATWPDSSDAGNDATQATSSKRPTFKEAILNSLPVVRFDGVDDFLSFAGSFAMGHIFAVIAPTGIESYGSLLATTPERHILIRSGTSNNMYFDGNSIFNASSMLKNGTGSTVLGTAAAVFSTQGTPETRQPILGKDVNGGGPASGDIAGILIFSDALNDANRQAVEAALSTKYAL